LLLLGGGGRLRAFGVDGSRPGVRLELLCTWKRVVGRGEMGRVGRQGQGGVWWVGVGLAARTAKHVKGAEGGERSICRSGVCVV
jgi:hypothetical protein